MEYVPLPIGPSSKGRRTWTFVRPREEEPAEEEPLRLRLSSERFSCPGSEAPQEVPALWQLPPGLLSPE
eukprot:CAMPEP_0177771598 /NCGR_PEP_ID=MMETSP0491_2-20121128/11698_1 /TAXON_ID=63592 /ORGANISM="Tetraselmis chuii, Strain PLY429" /LENGTH=68 /DNA_ID=CAMNT_0019289199 /DNA_START=408 /DNA_END=614 /DNA_ORIENTATION=+